VSIAKKSQAQSPLKFVDAATAPKRSGRAQTRMGGDLISSIGFSR
jgi:hypothetical protein